jgi:hypothetical protein
MAGLLLLLLLLLGGVRAVMDAGDGQNSRAGGDAPSGWRPMETVAPLENRVSYKEYFGIVGHDAPTTKRAPALQTYIYQKQRQAGVGRAEYGEMYKEMSELVKENLTMGVVVSIRI